MPVVAIVTTTVSEARNAMSDSDCLLLSLQTLAPPYQVLNNICINYLNMAQSDLIEGVHEHQEYRSFKSPENS